MLGTVIVRVRVKDGHLVNSTVRVLVTLGLWMSAVVVFAGWRVFGTDIRVKMSYIREK